MNYVPHECISEISSDSEKYIPDIMNHSDDETPLVSGDVKLYKRRWYILLIFSLVAVLQGKLLD